MDYPVLILMWVMIVTILVKCFQLAYRAGQRGNYRPTPKQERYVLVEEPASDSYGSELGKVRTAEAMREAAAHACRVIALDAANKARMAHEASVDTRLTEEDRATAVSRQKAWLYTCEAAERCEREIRSLGLR